MNQEVLTNDVALRVAIGQKLSEILNLKMNKKTGLISTAWGNKTIQGLGSTVIGIIEDECERLEYFSKEKTALVNLYYAVPSQTNDNDWWPDELTKAMDEATKFI